MKTHKSSDSGAAHERTARLFTGDTSFKWVHRAHAGIIDVAALCVFVTPCQTYARVSYEKNCALGIRRSNSVPSAPTRNHFARRPFSVHFCVYAAYHQLASTVNLMRRAHRRVYVRTHIQDVEAACDSAAAALQQRQWQSSHRSVAALPVNFPLPHAHERCCYMRSGAAVLIEDSI